jgi:hypothetical protein
MIRFDRNSLLLKIQKCSDASKVNIMLEDIDLGLTAIADKLLGLIDYYETVFKIKGLSKRESEFRNNKLSLIIDLIQSLTISEDMLAEVRSAIIAGWMLKIRGSTSEKRSVEIDIVLQSIERLRTAIKWVKEHPGSDMEWQLDLAVLRSISIRPLDLAPEDVHIVHNLLDQAVEYLEKMIDGSIVSLEPDSVLLQ